MTEPDAPRSRQPRTKFDGGTRSASQHSSVKLGNKEYNYLSQRQCGLLKAELSGGIEAK